MKKGQSKYNDSAGTVIGNWKIVRFLNRGRVECECNSCKLNHSVLAKDLYRGLGCKHCFPRSGSNSKLFRGVGEISRTTLKNIKENADIRQLNYNLTDEYLWKLYQHQNGKCKLSGVDIHFGIHTDGKTREQSRTASLDRIDPTKGYVKGNVQWLHKDVNMMKRNFSEEYFITLCRNVYENTSKL